MLLRPLPPHPPLLPLLLERLDLPTDFTRCLHIFLRCSVLPHLLHFALRNRHFDFSCPLFYHNRHTLTQQNRFPLTWAEQHSNPQSFADTDPRLYTTQPKFEEHEDVSADPEIVFFWAFPRPVIVSVSRASSRSYSLASSVSHPFQPFVIQTVRGCPLELKHI